VLPALAALALLGVVLSLWVALTVPLPEEAGQAGEASLLLEASNGELFATRGSFVGAHVDLAELPAHVIDAVLSIEDRRFFSHWGLDLKGIGRAMVANLTAGAVREGGSTITQQLARLMFLSQERSLKRKLQEAVLAVWLELRLTKEAILERYLNRAYFGGGAYGIEGAAWRYFGKPARELSLSEAAMLAGLIQAPSVYAPTRDLEQARTRAAVVLGAMQAASRLDAAAAEAAQAQPASLAVLPEAAPGRRYFADWIAGEARQMLGPLAGEFAVRTTLDLELQTAAEKIVERWLAEEGAARGASQAALLALGHDGAVLAMVGGRDYAESQFNRATMARRQPGSLFKLFVYMAAMAAGLTPDTVVEDRPIDINGWQPQNHGGRHLGAITLREAFAESVNTVAALLQQQLGAESVIAMARSLGIESPLAPDPSLALGTSGVTLLEMVQAYAAVAAGRPKVESYGISRLEGHAGRVFERPALPPPDPTAPLPWPRRQVLDLLLAAVRSGTAANARLERPAAGKTGTTQDNRDAWFVGFTADAVVGVWVGNDDNSPMQAVTGGGLPALIWRDFMNAADRLKADAGAPVAPPAADG
jgi:1A family penicillin-binding protein